MGLDILFLIIVWSFIFSLVIWERNHKVIFTGGRFMYIVQDTQAEVQYTVGFTVTDAKGQPVDDKAVSVSVVSDTPAVVTVTPNATDPKSGTVSFGNEGTANINCTITDTAKGTVLGSFGAQFTVTAGDPTAIAGGNIVFTGLTEAPAPAPAA